MSDRPKRKFRMPTAGDDGLLGQQGAGAAAGPLPPTQAYPASMHRVVHSQDSRPPVPHDLEARLNKMLRPLQQFEQWLKPFHRDKRLMRKDRKHLEDLDAEIQKLYEPFLTLLEDLPQWLSREQCVEFENKFHDINTRVKLRKRVILDPSEKNKMSKEEWISLGLTSDTTPSVKDAAASTSALRATTAASATTSAAQESAELSRKLTAKYAGKLNVFIELLTEFDAWLENEEKFARVGNLKRSEEVKRRMEDIGLLRDTFQKVADDIQKEHELDSNSTVFKNITDKFLEPYRYVIAHAHRVLDPTTPAGRRMRLRDVMLPELTPTGPLVTKLFDAERNSLEKLEKSLKKVKHLPADAKRRKAVNDKIVQLKRSFWEKLTDSDDTRYLEATKDIRAKFLLL